MKKDNIQTIEGILNFDFSDNLELNLLPKEEQEEFNKNLFSSLIQRIVTRGIEKLSKDEQESILDMMEKSDDMEDIFKFIADKNTNFIEEAGEEFLNFKEEIYELLN